jgi:hypothetical protein
MIYNSIFHIPSFQIVKSCLKDLSPIYRVGFEVLSSMAVLCKLLVAVLCKLLVAVLCKLLVAVLCKLLVAVSSC